MGARGRLFQEENKKKTPISENDYQEEKAETMVCSASAAPIVCDVGVLALTVCESDRAGGKRRRRGKRQEEGVVMFSSHEKREIIQGVR